ncbi:MAG: hypothetical protein ACTSWE_13525 [Promethearchaeota archaeon]
MSEIAENIRYKMMNLLKEEEEKTDLENLVVLSRVGMKVASAHSAELDADAVSASSTALIDLGLRLTTVSNHGDLKEIILHNSAGYSILIAVNDDYMVFGGLKAIYRVGYYLGYLRELARKLNILLSGGEFTEMALSLEEKERQKLTKKPEPEPEKDSKTFIPSIEQDKQALGELLGFLDEWEQEGVESEQLEAGIVNNVVSIPKFKTPHPSEQVSFKVYEDEIPPVPLDDYTPIEIEEEPSATFPSQPEPGQPSSEPPPSQELPSFEELKAPEFDEKFIAKEYDSNFILEEESETLDSILKELGWEEEKEEEK